MMSHYLGIPVDTLVGYLDGREQPRRRIAAELMPWVASRVDALPARLTPMADDPDPVVRDRVRQALRMALDACPPQAVAQRPSAPPADDPWVTIRAMSTRASLTPDRLGWLRDRMQDANESTRWPVLLTLREIAGSGRLDPGLPMDSLVPALITLLDHDDVIARGLSLGTLTHLRDLAAPAVQRLTRLLDEAPIEEDVVSALKAIGPAAASAVPKLLACLDRAEAVEPRDDDAECRLQSIYWALGRMGSSLAVSRVLASATGGKGSARCLALETLGDLGPVAGEAVPVLLELCDSPEAPVRDAAVVSAGKLGRGVAGVEVKLLEVLSRRRMSDPDKDSRAEAARALGHLGSTSGAVVAALVEATRDREDTFLCTAAVGALEELGLATPEIVRALAGALDCEDARGAAAHALGALGGRAREALPELRRLHRSTPEDCSDRDLLSDAIDTIEGQLG